MTYDKRVLTSFLYGDYYMDPNHAFGRGRCNDDAVDFCIICHCLGKDPEAEFSKLLELWGSEYHVAKDSTFRELAEEHIARVVPYLERWGEAGTMEATAYFTWH